VVRLEVPAELRYRALVVRAVAAACRVARAGGDGDRELDLAAEFDQQIISALSEAFNNIVIHAYKTRKPKGIVVETEVKGTTFHLRLYDFGESLVLSEVPEPDLNALPENGMGLFIVRSCVDEFTYTAGSPNVWSLKKNLPAA
jgi:serine/threonine-protein kinase RsbW